ncbi:unnamed protein product, partial [Amoebophrya sp. A120]
SLFHRNNPFLQLDDLEDGGGLEEIEAQQADVMDHDVNFANNNGMLMINGSTTFLENKRSSPRGGGTTTSNKGAFFGLKNKKDKYSPTNFEATHDNTLLSAKTQKRPSKEYDGRKRRAGDGGSVDEEDGSEEQFDADTAASRLHHH